MIKKRKHHFQLLEIMIAMILILSCAVPALRIYTNMYKQEIQTVKNYEADHVAHLIHAKIIEQMYKNTIPVDAIYNEFSGTISDPNLEKELKKSGFKASYAIINIHKRSVKGEPRYLCQLTISLQNRQHPEIVKKYQYLHYVEAPPPPGETLVDDSGQPDTAKKAKSPPKAGGK